MDSEAEARRSVNLDCSRVGTQLDSPFYVARWRVDPLAGRMTRGDRVVRLEPKAMKLLAFLAHRRGKTVTRRELMMAVWPDVIVGDDSLNRAISYLRRHLEDGGGGSTQVIETIPTIGYRLVAPATPSPKRPDPEPRTRTRWSILHSTALLALVVTVAGWLWIRANSEHHLDSGSLRKD